MTTTYSPHHDGGGTLHLPSPTHLDRSSSTSTLAQLRRSLSKSPSKHSAFRLLSSKSASHSPKSPLSPQARLGPFSLPVDENSLVSSPLAAAFPPSAKKPRPPLRRLSPMGATFALDNSSAKKPLSESSDHGNGTPNSSDGLPSETGKLSSQNSFAPPYTGSKGALKGTSERHDQFLSPSLARTRKDKAVEFADLSAAKSSPLKRSDGCADLDMVQMGSPAKRRSLHFPSLGSGFDIFDQSPLHQSTQMARSNSDTLSAESPTRSEFANSFSPLPKRASSLRKTTLQQRHDKPTFSKTKPSASLAFEMHTPGTSSLKSRARLSLDHPTAHPNRGSPFAHATSLPSASVHPLQNVSKDGSGDFHHAATKHPLSRTLTTSSTSTFEDDSPTHAPVRHVEIKKTMHDFSKSLPLGATRPASRGTQMVDSSSQDTDFSTPESYKLAKPMPAAFMSTGLISKRQKNIAQEQLDFQGSIGHMPDTPCKRPTSNVAVGPVPTPDVHVEKVQKRNHAHSFGSPSTPLGSSGANPAPAFAKGTSVFGSGFQDGFAARRGSFFGGEGSVSPLGVLHAQRGASVMVPPTPTKHLMACDLSESPEVDMADSATPPRDGSKSPFPDPDCKSPVSFSGGGSSKTSPAPVEIESPSAALRFRSFSSIPSFSSNRFNVLGRSRACVPRKSLSIPVVTSWNKIAKSSPLSPASPILERHSRKTPQTPSENMVPPDPSSLSISGPRVDAVFPPILSRSHSTLQSSSVYVPATPTAPRDSLGRSIPANVSVTPIHHNYQSVGIDSNLTSRFDKVELIGNGEFSQVFRVVQPPPDAPSSLGSGYFAPSPFPKTIGPRASTPALHTSFSQQVYAVKKTRNAFIGPRDRARKLQEVEVLRALGDDSPHTLHMFDSWEADGHLYIQTEYCDEKSLDKFLQNVGRKWRLDDFRIWKILLELALVRPSPNCSLE